VVKEKLIKSKQKSQTSPLSHRVTLAELAAHCNLSKSTVSRILNGRFGQFPIRPETIESVRRASVELGYRRNRLARAMADQRTHLVGISFPTLPSLEDETRPAGPFFSPVSHHFISGVFSHPLFAAYDLVIHRRDRRGQMTDAHEGDDLLDGLLYVDPEGHSEDFLRNALRLFPIVVMGTVEKSKSWLMNVDVNNRSIGARAAAHLIECGARRLVVVTPKNYASFTCLLQREEGFLNHTEKLAPVGVETSVIRMGNDMDVLRNPLFQMVKGDGPVGIFLTAEYLCGKVGNALHSMGLSFPDPILLISSGVQNHEPHEMAHVTSIDVPLFDMAMKATDLLLRILNGEMVYTPGFHEIPAVLTVRGSCGEYADSELHSSGPRATSPLSVGSVL